MAKDTSMNGERKKTAPKEQITLRFDLKVDSPTEDCFSEFSYIQLVRDQKKQQKLSSTSLLKDGSTSNSGGIFPDDSNEQLASIARKFEEKYGPKPSKKRKRMINDSDYIDRGYGYDLTDSFVDDSEFYEDFVPDHVDTKYGGFYINAGGLEFKTAEDIDEVDFVVKKKRKIKKQPSHQTPQAILASQKLKKAKQHAALQKAPSGAKKALYPLGQSHNKQPPLKKPCKVVKPTPPSGASTLSLLPGVPISIGGKSVTVPHVLSSTDTTASSLSVSTTVESGSGVKTEEQAVNKPPPELPSNLPNPVLEVVSKLREKVAADKKQEGKVTNQQREGYIEILLEVESACKSVAMKTRNAVFEFLAHLMGVARGTLTKRMKQLAKKKEDDALEGPLGKLQQAINKSMPRQIALYEEELKKARSESVSSAPADKSTEMDEDTRTDEVFDEHSLLPEVQSSSSQASAGQGSGGLVSGSQSGAAEGSNTKTKRLPRKKYRWAENEEVKTLLFEVVRVKVRSEESCSRFSREKGEEVIYQFLEDKVRPLWPKGWMPKSVLYKITEPVHKNYTTPLNRRVVKKEKQPGPGIAVKKEGGGASQLFKQLPTPQGSPVSLVSSSAGGVDSVSPRLMGVVQTMLTTTSNSKVGVLTTSTVPSVPQIVAASDGKQAGVKPKAVLVNKQNLVKSPAEKPVGVAISAPLTFASNKQAANKIKSQVAEPNRQPVLSLAKTVHSGKKQPVATIVREPIQGVSKALLKPNEHTKTESAPKTSNIQKALLSGSSQNIALLATSQINSLLMRTLSQQPQSSMALTLSPSTNTAVLNVSTVPSVASAYTTGTSTNKRKVGIITTGHLTNQPKVCIAGGSSQYQSPRYVSAIIPGVVQPSEVSKPTSVLASGCDSLVNKVPQVSSSPVSIGPSGSKPPPKQPLTIVPGVLVSKEGRPAVIDSSILVSSSDQRCTMNSVRSPAEQIYVEHSYLRAPSSGIEIKKEQESQVKRNTNFGTN